MTKKANSDKTETSSAALRALRILETIASSPIPLTATEINRELQLPKPTIHRLCIMLENEGYLQLRLDGRGYLPGKRLSNMAIGIFSNNDHWSTERLGILQRLSDDLGETCNIAVPDGSEMTYFDRVESHWPLRIQLQKNDRVPLHCTASGKLFLNNLPTTKRTRLLSKLDLEKMTPNTITDIKALKDNLKELRKEGIGTDNEEFLQGMIAVAVPLNSADGNFYGSLAMHAPTARMDLETALGHIPRMQEAANELLELIKE